MDLDNFLDDVKKILNKKENTGKQCIIYLGKFHKYGGSYNIEKNVYTDMLSKCKQKFKKCRVNTIKEYYYNDMVISLDQNKKEFYRKETSSDSILTPSLCFFIKTKQSLELEKFPIIANYNNVINKNITTFNNTPIIISFVTELTNNNTTNSIVISVYNKSESKEWLISKLKETIILLS